MGPGKPYSNRPAGLTGAFRAAPATGACGAKTCAAGTGTDGRGAVEEVEERAVVVAMMV